MVKKQHWQAATRKQVLFLARISVLKSKLMLKYMAVLVVYVINKCMLVFVNRCQKEVLVTERCLPATYPALESKTYFHAKST